jgi:cystathionine beta-synthase
MGALNRVEQLLKEPAETQEWVWLLAAVIKGYKCIFTTTDKQSKEKVDALRAFGAEVIVCPTDVDPEDPRSYYSVSSRLVNEIPNAWKPNQYDNLK